MAEDGGRGKVVIFSQFKAAVLHMRAVLAEEGIGNVGIVRSDSRESMGHAIASFNGDDATHVFVLHASACAAGLTLTAARHVFLLEPFLRAGEEAQARNRVHRIGQTRDVVARTYFTCGTIEERILAGARQTARRRRRRARARRPGRPGRPATTPTPTRRSAVSSRPGIRASACSRPRSCDS